MIRRIACLAVSLVTFACTLGSGVTSTTSDYTGATGSPLAGKSGVATAPNEGLSTPGVTASAAATEIVPNSGTFIYASGQAPHYIRTEKGAQAGREVLEIIVSIYDVRGDTAQFKVLGQAKPEIPPVETGSGNFNTKTGNPFSGFVDVNLNPLFGKDVLASARNQGDESVTVPAGTFSCTKTLYDKEKGGGSRVNITLWINGTVGLVKAQVSNLAVAAGATLTADIRYELKTKP